MGWKTSQIPPSVMKRIVEQEPVKRVREAAPEPVPTPKYLAGEEKRLQQDCENYLRQHDIFYLRMRMDRANKSVPVGFPDFTLFFPRQTVVLVEMKVQGGKLSDDQIALHSDYQKKTGCDVRLVTSFDQFVELVRMFLADTSHGPPQTTPRN